MSSRAFRSFTLGVLGYTLAVIAWGAFVRATGSGDGCGSHWPICNGAVIPRDPSVATLIEYSHRLTSGLALVLVLVLGVWAFRAHPRGHVVRSAAVASVIFMLLEAAIGAGLVLLRMVALEASARRALWMSVHLINTFLLLSALGSCALHAWRGDGRVRFHGPLGRLMLSAQAALLVVGASGGVAALGDTLVAHGVTHPVVAVLIQLRIFHPLLAVAGALLCGVAAAAMRRTGPEAGPWAVALAGTVGLQLLVGLANVALKAPVWMQLVHLLVADAVWLSLVLGARVALGSAAEHELRSRGVTLASSLGTGR